MTVKQTAGILTAGTIILITFLFPLSTRASFPIIEPLVIHTIDFAGFSGAGFAPDPSAGQLDSDTWRVSGMSDGDLPFGGTETAGDHAQGPSTGDVGPSGIYAFEVSPGVITFGVKPSNSDFTPGEFVLRIQNSTADQIIGLQVSYDLWVNNNQPYSTSWSFHHSPDDLTYQQVVTGDYISGEAADGLGWQKQTFLIDINGISLDHTGLYYLKWASDDASGHGQRDEFGLNNIEITATVVEVNYPPEAFDDIGTTDEDISIVVDVLANDTDPDGDILLLDSFSQPTDGTVSRQENGTPLDSSDDTLLYTPDQDWSGEDSFTYTINDGYGESDTATVTVVVSAVNDPPDAVDDSDTTQQDTAVTIDVLSNDSDPELDPLYLDSFTQPSHGSVSRDDNGTAGDTTDDRLVYSPAAGWSGEDSFTYTISDGQGGEDAAGVSVTVEEAPTYLIYLPLVLR